MEGFAVTDAPGLDTDAGLDTTPVDASTDTGLHASQDTDVADGATGPAGEPQEGAPPADGKGEFRAVQDGRLGAEAKATIEKLKLENPALAKAVQRALFAEDRLRRELPGGFKDIADLRAKLEDLGGDEGIQGMRGELDGWKDFDAKYTAGDPAVLKFLTETPEASAAFLQLAPSVFEKFRELNAEGYGAYVSQVFLSDMVQNRIPLALERLQDFIPADNPTAQAVVKQLVDYVNRINGFAQKQVTAPKAAPAADDKRLNEVTQRETALTRKEWGGETSARHANLFTAQWKAQIGERKLTSEQSATVKELYGLKLGAILKATPKFNDTLERYFNSKQKDGFLRHFDSVYKDAVPKALRAAIAQAGVGAKPGPKPGEVSAKPGAVPAKPGAKPAPATGFTLTNAKPASDTVDRVRTSTDMWLAGKAILKNGTRVQWTR